MYRIHEDIPFRYVGWYSIFDTPLKNTVWFSSTAQLNERLFDKILNIRTKADIVFSQKL